MTERSKQKQNKTVTRISYIKKPFSVRSRFSLGFAVFGLLMTGFGLYLSVSTNGQAAMNAGALGLCSMVVSALAVWYGIISFLEKDKNYLLAKIGIAAGGVLFIAWVVVIIIGFGG